MTNSLKTHLQTILVLLACLLSSACDKSPSNESKQQAEESKSSDIIELNNANVKAFSEQISQHYLELQAALLDSFYAAREADNSYEFIQFRNRYWTDEYIKLKNKYTAAFNKNKAFLADHPSAQLYAIFENLIYIGLDLKNGFLDANEEQMQSAIDAAERDKQKVLQIMKDIR
ncbi:MAG TPA: hypothetical protein ENI26_01050 [Methylophaga aminisulfidivorans]|uniref:Uncharacterized protein n=2 Tax=root TaxID=1 RepID=A0A7C1VVP8_9GAMM|nr:hypothetical protein [Methylophaga aminisulfidivorans]